MAEPFDPAIFDTTSGRRLAQACDTCEDGAMLSIVPQVMYFGHVPLGSESDWQPLIVTNTGTISVGVTLEDLLGDHSAEFEIGDGGEVEFNLAPGENVTYSLRFVPQGQGTRIANAKVTALTAGEQPLVALVGINAELPADETEAYLLRQELLSATGGQIVGTATGTVKARLDSADAAITTEVAARTAAVAGEATARAAAVTTEASVRAAADLIIRAEFAAATGAQHVGTTGGVSVDTRLITLSAALANGTVAALVGDRVYATKADLDGDLDHDDESFALVYNDPSAVLNDLYVKDGAFGAGSWQSAGIFARAIEALELPTVDTLPLDPFSGQRIVWGPTSETASYDEVQGTWLRADGTPLAVVYENFEGAVGTQLDGKLLQFTRDPVQASPLDIGTFSKLNDGEFQLDGNGRLMASTLAFDALGTMNAVPARCIEREFMFGIMPKNVLGNHAAGIYVVVDGFAGLRFSLHEADRGMRLRHADTIANTTTDLDVAFIPLADWSSTTVQRFWGRYWYDSVAGTYKCRILHLGALGAPNVAAPTEVSVDVPVGIKPSSMAGVYANGANCRPDYFHIYALDDNIGLPLDEGLLFEGLRTIDEIFDNDGVAVRDITGNGLPDILACGSTNGNGVGAGAFWYEQVAPGKFYKHIIDQNANVATTDRFNKIEGCTWWDPGDGVPTAVVTDQTLGKIFIYRPMNPSRPQGEWRRTELSGYLKLQDIFVEDIDGDGREEIITAYEGQGAADGGIIWVDWTFGADPLNAASYTVHDMVAAMPGPWSFLKRAKFIWMGGELVLPFTCRDNGNLATTVTGIFVAIRPAVVTDPWTVKQLFDGGDERQVCWIDIGNFSGNNNWLDIVYGIQFETEIRYLEYPDVADPLDVAELPWTSVLLTDPGGTRENWNVMALEINGMERTGLVSCQDSYGVVFNQYVDAAWKETLLVKFGYSHPSEKPNVPLLDLYGDGRLCQVHADSGGHRLMVLTFRNAG
jgi:hypothetical protein